MMSTKRTALVATLMLFLAGAAFAHEYAVDGFKIIHPWAAAAPAGSDRIPVYLHFEEVARGDRLLSARSQIAEAVELHATADDKLIAPSLEIGENKLLRLAPDAAHLSLRHLKIALQDDRSYPLTLEFERVGIVETTLSIGDY